MSLCETGIWRQTPNNTLACGWLRLIITATILIGEHLVFVAISIRQAPKFVTFSLDLLNTALWRNRCNFRDPEVIKRLKSMFVVIGNTLYSTDVPVLILGMHCATRLAKCPSKAIEIHYRSSFNKFLISSSKPAMLNLNLYRLRSSLWLLYFKMAPLCKWKKRISFIWLSFYLPTWRSRHVKRPL